MPFVHQNHRDKIRKEGPSACEDVGDICFVFYDQMVKVWKREPRWRTAHRIRRDFGSDDFYAYVANELHGKFARTDVATAHELAWQVFFQNYVMPYEREKELENGTI